jgi:hypothetical protein
MMRILHTFHISRGASLRIAKLVAFATALSASPAYSQQGEQTAPAEANKPSRELMQEVLALVREGNELFDKGDFAAAYTRYKQAYEKYQQPAILYRLAQSAENMGSLREAVGYYQEFVKLQPNTEAGVKVAQETLPALYAKVKPKVRFVTEPAGATIYIGTLATQPIGTTPFETEELPAGKTRVIFRRAGFENAQQEINLGQADEREVRVALIPSAEPVDPPKAKGDSMSGLAIAGWTSTGVGVATLITAGIFSGLSASATNEVNNYEKRGPGASRTELESLKDSAMSRYNTSLVLYIAGGVLTATGAALLIYDGMQEEAAPAQPSTSIWLDGGFDRDGAWVGLQGRF